ncbi:MAG: ImmA/IrrE family metallo-endopeptidase [Deltaproteobacteria bacterium]|nr:ImmA/IrrE family metallo-endopeptidase [Deltaproteobacteria bacterium]
MKPELLRWACERAGLGADTRATRFPRLDAWLSGAAQPTLKQLEAFAKATNTPIGYLFSTEPPTEQNPIPDLRPIDHGFSRPSPNLRDTINICQERQEWYREYAATDGDGPVAFVGGEWPIADIEATASILRDVLSFDVERCAEQPDWTAARRRLVHAADAAGILVMGGSTVPGKPARRLDRVEFSGFAITDPLAPLVFVNAHDSKDRQMFTLAYELVKLWIGRPGVSEIEVGQPMEDENDTWCFHVAAEFLLPLEIVRREYDPHANLDAQVDAMSNRFKVPPLIVLRRIFELCGQRRINYLLELHLMMRVPSPWRDADDRHPGRRLVARVGDRFARALLVRTWEGNNSFSEALRLLGIQKMSHFRELGRTLGVLS